MPGEGFEEKYIWKIVYEILQGLKSLHKNNIIHRDIKSANIFFVKGIAKLGDLNVSKVAENGFCTTQTGTPYYTSP
jgi:serine/threonine protein kinase